MIFTWLTCTFCQSIYSRVHVGMDHDILLGCHGNITNTLVIDNKPRPTSYMTFIREVNDLDHQVSNTLFSLPSTSYIPKMFVMIHQPCLSR